MSSVTVSVTQLDKILKTLTELKTDMARLTEKVEDLEPVYGSDAWWEWSDKKAVEDIKAGRFVEIKNKDELQTYLSSLKSA